MSQPVLEPPPGFEKLSAAEQIEYVQSLWGRILERETDVPVPDWHREKLVLRMQEQQASPQKGRPWNELKAELEQKLSRPHKP